MLKQILIDADTGIDDSIAILFALKRPDVRVMGVTTGFGNTTARQAAENSLRLIRLAGAPYEVPVAVGATEPLAGNWKGPDPHIHGPNGIGGVELPPSSQQPLEEPAWAFIARMAREHPGELTLVTLARMTNLAKALEIEPDLPRLLKRVVFMGGTFHAPGNVSPVAEANIAGDPEAADRVFQAGFDLTMVGLDVTQKVRLTTDHVAILDKYAGEPAHCGLSEAGTALLLPVQPTPKQLSGPLPGPRPAGHAGGGGSQCGDGADHPRPGGVRRQLLPGHGGGGSAGASHRGSRRLHLRGCGQPPGPGRAAHHLYGMREEKDMRVVNFGSLNIDYVYRVDHFVQPGETMSAQSLQIQCGGKGLNQSVALARAGVETWHAGLIGPEGHFLKETLDRAGVHTRFVEESAGSTGHAIIQVDSTGQNSILLHDGANGRLTPDFVTAVLDQFSAGDTVLLQNETSCVEEIIHQAARRGMRTAMNAAPANEKLVGLPLEALSWLLVNEVEGAFLAGTEAPEAILDTLAARYPETTVVLTLGEQGAAAARGGWRAWGPARKTAVVDTTAAGDTFTGYFLRRALEGGTLEEALSLAAAASALAVSRPGAADAVPGYEEVLRTL